jgi:D-xylose 1-dehydrogenase
MNATATMVLPGLSQKSVLITGGSTGTGREIILAFAMQGAKVTFLDIDASGAQQTIDFAVQRNASKPRFIACDLTDTHDLRKAMTQCASSQGDVDILVNNAANDDRHTWESVEPEYWARLGDSQ